MDRRAYLAAVVAASLGGCAAPSPGSTDGDGDAGASPGDTPSTSAADTDGVRAETVAAGLEVPWGTAYRDGTLYVTERSGRVVRVADGEGETVFEAFPDLEPVGEGGLLGLAFHPSEPFAYTYGTYAIDGGSENRIVRHDLTEEWAAETLLDGVPGARLHDGGRLAVGDGALYATCGDATDEATAQDPSSLGGSVLRLTLDGEPHPDNPFDGPVFTYGHRNPQGLAVRDGTLLSTEHGPDVDDEINVLEAGNNYGWPEVTGANESDEYVDPLASYTPTIAPASAAFYEEGPIEAWRGDLFFGTLVGEHLHRVRFDGRRVVEQERLYEGEFGRLRTAFVGPDGHLHVTTSNRDGRGSPAAADDQVLRFVPA